MNMHVTFSEVALAKRVKTGRLTFLAYETVSPTGETTHSFRVLYDETVIADLTKDGVEFFLDNLITFYADETDHPEWMLTGTHAEVFKAFRSRSLAHLTNNESRAGN